MKRSESILVYGVTAVLAVILGVAIMFGNPPIAGASDTNSTQGDPASPAGAAQRDPLVSSGASTDGDRVQTASSILADILGEGASGDDVAALPREASADSATTDPAAPIVTPVALRKSLAALGSQRVEENMNSGERYRHVLVRSGDSLGVLIQRWCPGTPAADIQALNEGIDFARLQAGAEVVVPWIDDEVLLEALDARERNVANGPVSPPIGALRSGGTQAPSGRTVSDAMTGAGPVSNVAPAASPATPTGASYTVVSGDSLWKIAAQRVGANKAQSYVQQILAANPSLANADTVRAGQKLVLP